MSPSERRPWPLLSPHDRSHHSPPSVELLELPSLSSSVATEEPLRKRASRFLRVMPRGSSRSGLCLPPWSFPRRGLVVGYWYEWDGGPREFAHAAHLKVPVPGTPCSSRSESVIPNSRLRWTSRECHVILLQTPGVYRYRRRSEEVAVEPRSRPRECRSRPGYLVGL